MGDECESLALSKIDTDFFMHLLELHLVKEESDDDEDDEEEDDEEEDDDEDDEDEEKPAKGKGKKVLQCLVILHVVNFIVAYLIF